MPIGDSRTQFLARKTKWLWLAPLIALGAITIMLLTACSSDKPTQTPESDENQATSAPAVTVELPTPTPTPAPIPTPTVTPTFIPVDLPLPPTATPRPTPTLDPNVPSATPLPDGLTQETLEKIFCQLSASGGVTEDEIGPQFYPFRRFDHVASLLDDGRIIMGGGFTGNANNNFIIPDWHPTVDVYDPKQAAWCMVPLPIGLKFNNEFVPLSDGSLLMVGISWPDEQNGEPTPHTLILDAESLEFSQVAPPEAPSAIAQLALLDDGRVLRVGGLLLDPGESPESNFSATGVEIYDPASDSWAPASSIDPEPTLDPALTLPASAGWSLPQWLFPMTDGRTMFVRIGDVGESSDQGLIEIYDAATDSWHVEAEFNVGWDHPWHMMMTSTDMLYVFYEGSVDIYDPDTNLWSSTFNSRGIPSHSTVTELPDGRLLVAGGYRQYDVYPSSRTEIYDPSTTIWAAGRELAEPRRDHSATLMPDGSVLVFGGIGVVADIDEIAPWNTLYVIPAEMLTAIDTVTPPTDVLGSFTSRWETCIGQVALARQDFIPNGTALAPDALEELLASANQAMETLDSYAMVDARLRVNRLNPDQDSRFRTPYCNYTETQYDKSGKSRVMWTYSDGRRISGQGSSIHVGGTNYRKELDQDEWIVEYDQITNHKVGGEFYWLGEEFRSHLIDPRLGIGETLDGVDVHVVRAELADDGEATGDTITFWIGVEDNLLRRMFYVWSASPHNDGSVDTEYTLIEFHSFNEEFNILPPLTPEEAAHPRAFGWSRCEKGSWLSFVPRTADDAMAVAESPASIVMRASQAMDALTSYATVDARYGFGPWGQSCDLYLNQHMEEGLSTSRKVAFYDGELGSDESRIVIGEDEYNRDSEDGAWTQQAYDASMPISWQHAEFLNLALSDQVINLRVVDIEMVDGVACYRISGELVTTDGDDDTSEHISVFGEVIEDSLSLWIGVDDYLLRSAVTRRSRDGSGWLIGGDHRSVEFHSFDEDFDIQPPPADEVTE